MMKIIILIICSVFVLSIFSQEEISQEEQDLLNKVNAENAATAATAESQEAYNNGITLFGEKKYKEAIASFKTAIEGDPNFEAAYYNKGIAEIQSKSYQISAFL